MKWMNRVISLVLLLSLLIILGACTDSLQKPTGLEDKENQLVTTDEQSTDKNTEEPELEDKQGENIKNEETPSDENEKQVENQTSKETNKQDSPNKESKDTVTKEKQSAKDQVNKKAERQTKKETAQASKNVNKEKKDSSKKDVSKQEKPKQESPKEEKPKPKPKPKKPTVTQSITISANEIPLSNVKTEIDEGDTILDALIKVTREQKIQMDYRGGQGSGAYVEGIANVYEFDRGQGSGWMIRINGIFPNRGVGTIPIRDGDVIEWLYTTDLGKDLGADLQPFR